jgi:hypothetical protein
MPGSAIPLSGQNKVRRDDMFKTGHCLQGLNIELDGLGMVSCAESSIGKV